MHLAHRQTAADHGGSRPQRGSATGGLTFDPHPACVVAPERAPRLLTSLEERCELIREEGIEHILIQPFTADLAQLTPEEFATQFLRDGLGVRSAWSSATISASDASRPATRRR